MFAKSGSPEELLALDLPARRLTVGKRVQKREGFRQLLVGVGEKRPREAVRTAPLPAEDAKEPGPVSRQGRPGAGEVDVPRRFGKPARSSGSSGLEPANGGDEIAGTLNPGPQRSAANTSGLAAGARATRSPTRARCSAS